MASTAWRTIRVFISSTFRDMQAEREELVKRVFPQLRKMCEERGVTWGEVDLRWGINDEQTAEGKVLPICLAEIQRCRPYFIGLLGERYGWVPEEILRELIEQEPWLAEHLHHSVTELEILHGVLRDPEMAEHAFFYLRDPAYVDSLPPEQQPEFVEETPEGTQKLCALKDRIRASGFPVRERYPNPQALGQLVLEDLTEVIERLYPIDEKPDPLDREAAEHEAFAQSRARVYIGRQEYFARLDEHAAGDGPPLVVLGESGAGKSALLANWALRYREQHPDDLVVTHFIGASPYSADWAAMVRRIMGELKRRFDIQGDIPDKPDELRVAFANWLHMAAARGRVVIVLDALNQLEDREGAPDLVWLPPVIPYNARLLLSTLPGRPLDDLRRRGWPTLDVQPLTPGERTRLIAQYLAQYTKALSVPLAERISASDQTANPLFLTALLEELRLFGAHERLVEYTDRYLAANTIPELYKRILARWEADYERDRPGLVRDAMMLIWAARRGLSETELLELLGGEGELLPHALWSPLFLAAEQSLVSRSGLITFFHDYLREAVVHRYLPEETDRQTSHIRLADYFGKKEENHRKDDELPWQLAEAHSWERLRDCLLDLETLARLLDSGRRFEVLMYWRKMTDRYNMASEYAGAARAFEVSGVPAEVLAERIGAAAELLWTAAEHRGAEPLFRQSLEAEISGADPRNPRVARRLLGLAALLLATNQLRESEKLFREALSAQEATFGPNDPRISDALNQLASCVQRTGQAREAEALIRRALAIDEQAHGENHLHVARDLCNLAAAVAGRAEHKEREGLLRRALRIEETTWGPYHPEVAVTLNNLGTLLRKMGQPAEAEKKLRRALELDEMIFGPDHPDTGNVLGNLAVLLNQEGDREAAEPMFRRTLRIDEQAYGPDHPDVAVDLHNLASLLSRTGRQAEAETHWRRAIGIMTTTYGPFHPTTLQMATALREMQKLQVGTEREKKAAVLDSQFRLALGVKMKGDLGGAMAAFRKLEQMYRSENDWEGVQNSVGFQSEILGAIGDFEGALAADRKREQLCREHDHAEGLVISLAHQADLLSGQLGRSDEALPLAEEACQLAVRHGLGDLAQQARAILRVVQQRHT